jgi:hypothetical protein
LSRWHRDDLAATAVDDALTDSDPWHGFCGFIERVCQMQADDRGFGQGCGQAAHPGQGFGSPAEGLRASGCAADFDANAGVVMATKEAAPEAWRRLVGYLLQAFAAERAEPLPEPPTKAQMYRALMRLSPAD